MKKYILLYVIALIATCANATSVQKIILKNGSVLNGFIQQDDGLGNMTVNTDSAIICLKNINVYFSNETITDENTVVDVQIGPGKLDTLTAKSMISFERNLQKTGKAFSKVHLLERGSSISFKELTPNVYQISWNDIVSITTEKRPKNALSGINRKLLLKSNREIDGQYAGETEKTVSLYLKNGVIETVDFDQIQKYTYYGINPQQDIFAQSELIDVVNTNDNRTIRGVIIEQNYSSKEEKENYISIWAKNQSPQMLKISEIKFIGKEENNLYQPKYDIVLKEGEVVVNRKEVAYVGVKEQGDQLMLDSISDKLVFMKDGSGKTSIIVETKQSNSVAADMFQLVKIKKTTVKKSTFYGFSYKDLVNGSVRSTNVETSVNGTTKIEFLLAGEGSYVLYNAKEKRAIPFVIK